MCPPSLIRRTRLSVPATLSLALALRVFLIAVALLLAWAQFHATLGGHAVNDDTQAWAQHFKLDSLPGSSPVS